MQHLGSWYACISPSSTVRVPILACSSTDDRYIAPNQEVDFLDCIHIRWTASPQRTTSSHGTTHPRADTSKRTSFPCQRKIAHERDFIVNCEPFTIVGCAPQLKGEPEKRGRTTDPSIQNPQPRDEANSCAYNNFIVRKRRSGELVAEHALCCPPVNRHARGRGRPLFS